MKLALAALALALAAPESCDFLSGPAFTWQAERHHLRLDEAADSAEFLSLYSGLMPGDEDALDALRLALEGRRIFPPAGGFLSFDFDADLASEPGEEPDPAMIALRELAPSLSVPEVGLVLDEEGRVYLWRRVRIANAALWLETLESPRMRGAGPHFQVGEFPAFDDRSRELLESTWARGERFFALAGDSLVVNLPSTGANAAAMLRHLLEGALKDPASDAAGWAKLAGNLRDVEMAGERLRMRLGPDADGWMRVAWSDAPPRVEEPAAFDVASLRAAGLSVATWESLVERAPVLAK